MTSDPDDQLLTRYLLRDLDEIEQKTLEERYFEDERTYERLVIIEDELLADYARNVLPPDERRKIEARLLASPANRERVAVLEALWAGIDRPKASRGGVPRWAIAAAAAIAIAIGSWMVIENLRLRDELREGEMTRAELENQLRSRDGGTGIGKPPDSPVLALSLSPGLVRAAGTPLPTIRLSTPGSLELSLALPRDLPQSVAFATIRTPDDREVWSTSFTPASSGAVVLRVPAGRLPPDDYEVRLQGSSGASSLAEYYFGTRR